MTEILLRSPTVQARTGLPKSTLHNLARAGGFPRPVKIGIRAVAWRESDVAAWIDGRQQDGNDAPPNAEYEASEDAAPSPKGDPITLTQKG